MEVAVIEERQLSWSWQRPRLVDYAGMDKHFIGADGNLTTSSPVIFMALEYTKTATTEQTDPEVASF